MIGPGPGVVNPINLRQHRMRNTFIEPGDAEFDDMIGSIDRGIYAAQMGVGQSSLAPVNSTSR